MLEKQLWIAPPEIEKPDTLEDRWFYHDPLFNLCIQLSYFNSSNEESYGAVAVQEIDNKPMIIGLGWNMYMGGDTELKRQGYANHAEFQSAALAESIGYNLNDSQKNTYLYVAGRLLKENILFFSPEEIAFTCTTCTRTIPKYFKNATLVAPTKDKGWRYITMEEAYNSSLYFEHNNLKRENVLNFLADVSKLNISLEQNHMDTLIKNLQAHGTSIDDRLKNCILDKYKYLLQISPNERRRIVEGIKEKRYITRRGEIQTSLYI